MSTTLEISSIILIISCVLFWFYPILLSLKNRLKQDTLPCKTNIISKRMKFLNKNLIAGVILYIALSFFSSSCERSNDDVLLNKVQVIGSHNSYKIPIENELWEYLNQAKPSKAKSLQYGHISIEDQLQLGLRSIELDIFHDPQGGRFTNPLGLEIVKEMGKNPLPYDKENKLSEPGLKMFHIQDVDFRSHHLLFKDCLKTMKAWSDKNPEHTPIFILINAKDKVIDSLNVVPLPFTVSALDSIDKEIRSVFDEDQLITPDWVRGDYNTLEEVILKEGWPELNDSKGRFLFVLDEKEEKIKRYINQQSSLKNKVMFVNIPEGNPEAAFRIINDPVKELDYIKELVGKGYLVRTRADSGTKEARTNDYTKFEKAIESGAQVISTDYYIPSMLFQSSFKVVFEDGTYERIK